jgi:HD-like signal output (HDOD) protein
VDRLPELSCLLPVVRRAISALGDPACTAADLQGILAADQGVGARILRLANSAYFGVQRDVSTLSTAVTLIGFHRLEMMLRHILASEVLDALSARRQDVPWRIGVASGSLSFDIARRCWVGDPEELLAVGLLHNVGELALRFLFRDDYQAAVDLAQTMSQPEAEQQVFGVDSGRVGHWLLGAWSFPEIFGESSEHWRNPLGGMIARGLQSRLCVVHVAASLAHAAINQLDEETALSGISPQITERLQLTPAVVAGLYRDLPNRSSSLIEVLEFY